MENQKSFLSGGQGFSSIALIIVAVAVIVAGYFFWNATLESWPRPPVRPVPEKTQPQNNNEAADWKTYRNDDYGFEFEYPNTLGTVEYDMGRRYVEGSRCFLQFYFEESNIAELHRKNPTLPPHPLPVIYVCFSDGMALMGKVDDTPTLERLAKIYESYDPSEIFKKADVGNNLQGMELVNHPERGNILIVQLPKGFVEFEIYPSTEDRENIFNHIKQTIRGI
ncbi:MAG TPA: hypothetical protein VJJ73_00750 [Candidatus Paceibacterota bacterium]